MAYTVERGRSVIIGFRIKAGNREAYDRFARGNGFISFADMARDMAERAYEMSQRGTPSETNSPTETNHSVGYCPQCETEQQVDEADQVEYQECCVYRCRHCGSVME